MKRHALIVLILLGCVPAAAEPLSRAEAVARALERNPTVLRSVADRDSLRGRARGGPRRRAARGERVRLVPALPGPRLLQQPQHR